jgi:hypothetical protein
MKSRSDVVMYVFCAASGQHYSKEGNRRLTFLLTGADRRGLNLDLCLGWETCELVEGGGHIYHGDIRGRVECWLSSRCETGL